MILTQFDPASHAVIDPDMIFDPIPGFPQTIVSVFSHELFDRLVELLGGEEISGTHDVDGHWPIYRVHYGGWEVAFVKARLGAPAGPTSASSVPAPRLRVSRVRGDPAPLSPDAFA